MQRRPSPRTVRVVGSPARAGTRKEQQGTAPRTVRGVDARRRQDAHSSGWARARTRAVSRTRTARGVCMQSMKRRRRVWGAGPARCGCGLTQSRRAVGVHTQRPHCAGQTLRKEYRDATGVCKSSDVVANVLSQGWLRDRRMVCTHYNMREQQDRLFIVYYHLEPSPIASEAQCLRQVGLLNTGSLTAENG